MRKYKSGTAWGVWLWSDVVIDGLRYLLRLHLVKAPRATAMLHWILRPDPQPDPHDHPITFLSIVLRGGYTEWTPSGLHVVRWFNPIRRLNIHRIVSVKPNTLTLCLAVHPRKSRRWGFHTPKGWIYWKDYYSRRDLERYNERR